MFTEIKTRKRWVPSVVREFGEPQASIYLFTVYLRNILDTILILSNNIKILLEGLNDRELFCV